MGILTRPLKTLVRDLEKAREKGKSQLEARMTEFIEYGFLELTGCLECYKSSLMRSADFFSRDDVFVKLLDYAEQNGFVEMIEKFRNQYDILMENSVFSDEYMRKAEIDAEKLKMDESKNEPKRKHYSKEPVHVSPDLARSMNLYGHVEI